MKRFLPLLWWLLPILPAAASFFVLKADAPAYLLWWAALSLSGLVFQPLAARLFRRFPDSGWSFSKPLSLACASFVVFVLASLRILPFRQWTILLVYALLAALLWIAKRGWKVALTPLSDPVQARLIAFEEFLFGSMLLLWTFARGLKPLLDSLEKFMDYGFMMSMMRGDWLPAHDMWLAGETINYYYYGQYVYTFVTKLTGMQPVITYNLSMAATLAFTAVLSFALGYGLVVLARQKGLPVSSTAAGIGGLLTSFLVTFGGNSHGFFYGQNAWGNPFLKWLKTLGVQVGDTASFWFANSTRFIGYNPDTKDKTIHEFPIYSFLVADLHAHVVNLMFVLLLLGFLAVLMGSRPVRQAAERFRNSQAQTALLPKGAGWFRREAESVLSMVKTLALNPVYLLSAFLLGLFMMCNFWDFAIYLVVTALVLLFVNIRGYGALGNLESIPVFLLQMALVFAPFLLLSNPLLALGGYLAAFVVCLLLTVLIGDALTMTGAQVSGLFLVAHLVALPFNLGFEPISKSLALALNHTTLYQLLILWGTHFLLGALFTLYVIRKRMTARPEEIPEAAGARGAFSRFLLGIPTADLLAVGLFICAFGLILAPELMYVKDIYSGDYKRANTMFKFTYQAFVLFSIVVGYAIARLPARRGDNKVDNRWSVVSVFMVLLLIIPSFYPFVAIPQWLGKWTLDNYKGLDGLVAYAEKKSARVEGDTPLTTDLANDYNAVLWLNENVDGLPTILEAHGTSYTDYCRISAYTGLPTVIGWQTHEWLWRTSKKTPNAYQDVVVPRQSDVRRMYTWNDENDATDEAASREAILDLYRRYAVEYVIVGDIERQRFPEINETTLKALGEEVFSSGTLYIIRVDLGEG